MSVYVTGDIHGNVNDIRNKIKQIDNPSENDFIIIAGDAGFEYEDYIMGHAKREARKFPGVWIVLRGNHDSCYWKHEDDNGWEIIQHQGCDYLYQTKYPNIWYLPDEGCIYRIEDYNILFVPGAYSVDKWYRLRNRYPWNPDEQLSDIEKRNLEIMASEWLDLGFDIDFTIGHTFPFKVQRYYSDLFMSGLDQASIDKTTEHWLDNLSMIYESCPSFKQYFGGHFHDDRTLTDKYTMLFHSVKNLADYVKE